MVEHVGQGEFSVLKCDTYSPNSDIYSPLKVSVIQPTPKLKSLELQLTMMRWFGAAKGGKPPQDLNLVTRQSGFSHL